MKKEKKKFKDTAVGKFLKDKAPKILDVVDDFIPPLKVVTELIKKDDKLSEKDKEIAIQMAEYELKENEQITDRWHSDVNSDSWLSKNVRPLVMLYLLLVMTVVIVLSFWKIEIPDNYLALLEYTMLTVFAAYFGGRTIEKFSGRIK